MIWTTVYDKRFAWGWLIAILITAIVVAICSIG